MKSVTAAGVITFRLTDDELIEVLILDHGTHISHPKGHQEDGESLEKTALRELKEETDLDPLVASTEPIYTSEYKIIRDDEKMNKSVHYFGGVVHKNEVVRISPEHIAYYWKDVRAARKMITYEEDKAALDQAIHWLVHDDSAPIQTFERIALL